jgi:hypothetical protein
MSKDKLLAIRLTGIIAVCVGLLFLLWMFVWCTLIPPGLTGAEWWAAVLGKMVSSGEICGTMIGCACILGGTFLLVQRSNRQPSIATRVVLAVLVALIILVVAVQ